MAEAPQEFIDWLSGEMKDRNWGVRKTAEMVGVSHPVISDILNLGKQPSFETCKALAKTFNKRPEDIFRLAGLLPPEPNPAPELGEIEFIFDQLSTDAREEILEFARLKLARQGKKENNVSSQSPKRRAQENMA